jgi:dTDP-4-dehydrorhamnose 3,5-epimerase
MERIATKVDGAYRLIPKVFGDNRGFFLESWNRQTFAGIGIDEEFVQDNHSRSQRNVLRGLHYQIENPQGKLVWVTQGAVFDVFVDLRKNSPTFGKWDGHILSAENKERLWVPPGLAHGFLVLSDTADFQYKCTEYYTPARERTLLWNDPRIGIDWPLNKDENPILSAKDIVGKSLIEAELF